ncbi:hypothetical protein [Stigmatella erecta]|uniref:Alginate export domain-containing protein n=1 Tax=Stigmatella erecta TaxID=83460 RepID=A0A1I0K8R4_9BACT|nr:hypothetical protein [Stigmatella erecta]SEU20393.1 hypothetical protein SAMN05443639_109327 [Stigmatella erecta]
MRRAVAQAQAVSLMMVLMLAETASASAYQIEARTEAQAYQIRAWRGTTPDDVVLLPRRRIVQYLGFNAFELVTGQDLGFESNLRVYADLGLPRGEAEKVDGLRTEDADLLHAYARYARGGFEGRLGRQLYVDSMDIMAFDGLRLRYVSRLGLGAEVYGGLWVRGAGFLGSSVYQPDGTRESDARRLEQGVAGANDSLDALAPTYGAKLLLEDLKGFSGSVGYRKSLVDGKTDLERAGVEFRYGRGLGLSALAGLDFDMLQMQPAQVRAQVRLDKTLFAVSVEALRFTPVFSADSIWYYFAFAPRDEGRVRVDFYPVGPLRFYVQGLASLYHTEVNDSLRLADALEAEGEPSSVNAGGSAGVSMRRGNLRSALDVTYRRGYGGDQLWVDLTGGYSFDRGLLDLDGRVSVANVEDAFNPLLQGNFFGAQLWASRALSQAARLSLVLEQNFNAFSHSDTKVFFLFDLKANL